MSKFIAGLMTFDEKTNLSRNEVCFNAADQWLALRMLIGWLLANKEYKGDELLILTTDYFTAETPEAFMNTFNLVGCDKIFIGPCEEE